MSFPRSALTLSVASVAAAALLAAAVPATAAPERGTATTAATARPATAGTCPVSSAPTSLGGGAYQIDDSAQLQGLRDDSTLWDDSFILSNDIDLDSCAWGLTIGDDTTPFTGIFDGDEYAIDNIEISRASAATVSVGLFGKLGAGHQITDLIVTGSVTGTSNSAPAYAYVGGLAGSASGGIIDGVSFTGTVSATQAIPHATGVYAGGLVGWLYDDTITNSGVLGSTVTASQGDPHAGGLVGKALGGGGSGVQTWVTNSFVFDTAVTAQDQYSSGGSFAGGIAGAIADGVGEVDVSDVFASRARVKVIRALAAGVRGVAGGIAGSMRTGSLNRTYAYADITSVDPQGTDQLGRLVGYINADPTGSANFWDADIAGPSGAIGFNGGGSLSGTGVSAAAMETMSTFSTAGWAIVDAWQAPGAQTWGICEDQSYPYLLLQVGANPCSTVPTISGDAVVGGTLTASYSTPLATQEYRWWQLDSQGNEIPLIDYDDSYDVTSADIGSRLFVEGSASQNGVATTVYSEPTSVVPGSNPPPTYPPSAPLDVAAEAGDASASVTWSAPASSGSFAVSTYQVRAVPDGAACVTTTLTCEVVRLVNGTKYTFQVRALNGAGWGPWSALSNAVTPSAPPKPSITITGTRGELKGKAAVIITGTSTGLGMGAILRPWLRFPGQTTFAQGNKDILVDAAGDFSWKRRTGKKVTVYVQTPDGSVTSNRVTIRTTD